MYMYFTCPSLPPSDLPVDVSKWSIGDVKKFFESKPDCQPVLSLLEDQEIDGQALLLLSQDTMVKCLNIKLGPALKVWLIFSRSCTCSCF